MLESQHGHSATASSSRTNGSAVSSRKNSLNKQRLSVSTNSNNLDADTTAAGIGSFHIPSLVLPLASPTSANEGLSTSDGTISSSPTNNTPMTGNSNAGGGNVFRLRFPELKLVCPSPERVAPISKEDKLLFFSRQCSILTDYLAVGSRLIAGDWKQFVKHGLTHVVNCAGDICENYFEAFNGEEINSTTNAAATGASSILSPAGSSDSGMKSTPIVTQTRAISYLRLFLLDAQDEDLMCVLYPVMEFIDQTRREGQVRRSEKEIAMMTALAVHEAETATAAGLPPPPPNPSVAGQANVSLLPPRVLIHCQQGVSRSTALCIAYLMLDRRCDYEEAYTIVRAIRGICRPNFGFIAQLKAWYTRMQGWTVKSKPQLYRVAPHCSRDRRIVIKMVDKLRADQVDSRTIFILVTKDRIIIWIGALVLPEQERVYFLQIRKHLTRLRTYEHAPTHEIVIRQKQEQQFAQEWLERWKQEVYEVREKDTNGPSSSASTTFSSSPSPDPALNSTTAAGGLGQPGLERSPSQQLFLATLMSPNTLSSLNLNQQPSVVRSNSSSSPAPATYPSPSPSQSNLTSPAATSVTTHMNGIHHPPGLHLHTSSSPAGINHTPATPASAPINHIASPSPAAMNHHHSTSSTSGASPVQLSRTLGSPAGTTNNVRSASPLPPMIPASSPALNLLSPLKPPMHPHVSVSPSPGSSSSASVMQPHSTTSARYASTPQSAALHRSFSSSIVVTPPRTPRTSLFATSDPSLVGNTGAPEPEWQEASRSMWLSLNGTPITDLICSAYDEDYPSHEWMAMHLAAQAQQEQGGSSNHTLHSGLDRIRKSRSTSASGLRIPPLVHASSDVLPSTSTTTAGIRTPARRHSREQQREERNLMRSSRAGSRRNSATHSHAAAATAATNSTTGGASITISPSPLSASTMTSRSSSTAAFAAPSAIPVLAIPSAEFTVRKDWLKQRWTSKESATATSTSSTTNESDLEQSLMSSMLLDESAWVDALIADDLERFRLAISGSDASTPPALPISESLLSRAALCGSQRIVEFLLAQMGYDYTWSAGQLLTLISASNRLSYTLSVAHVLASNGIDAPPPSIYRLNSDVELVDQVMDVFHQHTKEVAPPLPPEKTNSMSSTSSSSNSGMTLSLPLAATPANHSPIGAPLTSSRPSGRGHRHHRSQSYEADDDDDDNDIENISSTTISSTAAVTSASPFSIGGLPLSARLKLLAEPAMNGNMTTPGEGELLTNDLDGDLSSASSVESSPIPEISPQTAAFGDQLNPLMIGLGDPVPKGFVANRSFFSAYTHDDLTSSDDELSSTTHNHHHLTIGNGRVSRSISRSASRLRMAKAEDHIEPEQPETKEGEEDAQPDPRGADDPSDALNGSRGRSNRDGDAEDDDDEEAAMDDDDVLVPSSSPSFLRSLYLYPSFEELTTFDVDDLLPDSILILELKPGRKKGSGSALDGDEDENDDDDEEEVAEVRNVRLMREKGFSHFALAAPISPLRTIPSSGLTSASPTAASGSATSSTISAPPSIVVSPPIYHVWFGRATSSAQLSSSERHTLAHSIVDEFRALLTLKEVQEQILINNGAAAVPTAATIVETPRILVEVDGAESEQFLAAFDEDD